MKWTTKSTIIRMDVEVSRLPSGCICEKYTSIMQKERSANFLWWQPIHTSPMSYYIWRWEGAGSIAGTISALLLIFMMTPLSTSLLSRPNCGTVKVATSCPPHDPAVFVIIWTSKQQTAIYLWCSMYIYKQNIFSNLKNIFGHNNKILWSERGV